MFIFILLGDSDFIFEPFSSFPKRSARPSCYSRMANSRQPHVVNTQPAALRTAKDLFYTRRTSYLSCGDQIAIVSNTKINQKMTNFPIIWMPIISSLEHFWAPVDAHYACLLPTVEFVCVGRGGAILNYTQSYLPIRPFYNTWARG